VVANLTLKERFLPAVDHLGPHLAASSKKPMTIVLSLPPVPVIFAARLCLCMFLDFPPMNV
jgi:hypothetical protein